MGYVPTIGLEIHAELKTRTKMFCRSKNDSEETRPNVNICPVCMAHPGTLPVINGEAIRHVLRVGIAIKGTLADYTEFDRKNYFYPDLPKGYQLSQFEYPLVKGGDLAGVQITRIHLEEDTASSIHDEATGSTVIDYNRAGVPLMELVTEPVIKSAKQAGDFARELQIILRHLGVSEANMEKGEMRVEANVSVAPEGERSATYVEIKNLNSFRAMERAVEYEIKRQTAMLERGEKLEKQTLGWDDAKQATFPQRTKEGSADYRYFPDPDLPSLKLSEMAGYSHEELSKTLPELPQERRTRYATLGVSSEDAEAYIRDPRLGSFFDEVAAGLDQESVKLASNYISNDLVKLLRDASGSQSNRDTQIRDTVFMDDIRVSASNFRKLIDMVRGKKLSSRAAKDLLALMIDADRDPESLAVEHGVLQSDDAGALDAAVGAVVARHESVVADFRAGKEAALEFLLGQCMRDLRGAADPQVLRELLRKKMT